MDSGALMSIDGQSILTGYGPCQRVRYRTDLDPRLPAFYFPDFFLQDNKPWRQYAYYNRIEVEAFRLALTSLEEEAITTIEWVNPYKELFQQICKELQADFEALKIVKAVPYLFAYTAEHMDVVRLRHSLKSALEYIQRYPGYLYGCWDRQEGILGVTPEILFTYHEPDLVKTVALAGTCSKQSCLELFKNDQKEIREHQLVVEGIQKSLHSFGVLHIGQRQLLSLANLVHFITPIELRLSQTFDFEAIIRALHPTPALGVFPKENGLNWLYCYNERIERRRYGAPVGCFYPQYEMACCLVSIRNVQWDKRGMCIGAGCGLIKESSSDKEWNEIILKMQSIRELLAL